MPKKSSKPALGYYLEQLSKVPIETAPLDIHHSRFIFIGKRKCQTTYHHGSGAERYPWKNLLWTNAPTKESIEETAEIALRHPGTNIPQYLYFATFDKLTAYLALMGFSHTLKIATEDEVFKGFPPTLSTLSSEFI